MRRDPQTILAAHRMDPGRRELFVEGTRDVNFFTWLLDSKRSRDSRILPAALLDVPASQGGERGRLMALARFLLEHSVATIRIFADADYDAFLDVPPVEGVILTDGRDLEGYFLTVEGLDKFLRLGLHRADISAESLLGAIHQHGRKLGVLRLASLRHGWQLPFQDTPLRRYINADGATIEIQYDALVQTLLQNAGYTLREKATLLAQTSELAGRLSHVRDADLTHGKDAVAMLAEVCHSCEVPREAAERMLWTSFERQFGAQYPRLHSATAFLQGVTDAG